MTGRAGWSPAILGTAQSEVGHVAATAGTQTVGGVGSAEGRLIAKGVAAEGSLHLIAFCRIGMNKNDIIGERNARH